MSQDVTTRYFAACKGAGYSEVPLEECKGIQCYKVYFDDEDRPLKMKVFDDRGEFRVERFWHYPSANRLDPSRGTTAHGVAYEWDEQTDDIGQTVRCSYHYPEEWEPPESSAGPLYWVDWTSPTEAVKVRSPSVRLEEANGPACEYDDLGRAVKEVRYDLDGSVSSVEAFHYDDQSRVLRQDYYLGGLFDECLHFYRLFEYDGQSRVIRRKEFKPEGDLIIVCCYRYLDFEMWRLGEETEHSLKRGLTRRIEYAWDEFGHFLEEVNIYRNDELSSKTVYTYDNLMNLISEEIFSGDGILDFRSVYEYDIKGRLVGEESFIRFPTDC